MTGGDGVRSNGRQDLLPSFGSARSEKEACGIGWLKRSFNRWQGTSSSVSLTKGLHIWFCKNAKSLPANRESGIMLGASANRVSDGPARAWLLIVKLSATLARLAAPKADGEEVIV
jgi:hypothetical protein